jgi:competence protein ComEA
MEKRSGIDVMLGAGFPHPGLHQYSDGIAPSGVIEMTGLSFAQNLAEDSSLRFPLQAGEVLDVVRDGSEVLEIKRSWLPALQRMALGIVLHPDQMNYEDWQALTGIGPRLAQRIEEDRQRNGDFGNLEALERVRGIGPRRIEAWRKFF